MNEYNIEAIFFDLGRVIVDFDYAPVVRKLLAASRKDDSLDFATLFDWFFHPTRGANRAFDCGRITPEQLYDELRRHFGITLCYEDFVSLWNGIFSENREVTEMIETLAADFRLFLISNTNPLHFQHISDHFSVLRRFEAFFLSYRIGACKPEEMIFRTALSQARVEVSRSLFIDDVSEYVEAAKRLGLHGCHFTSAKSLKNYLSALLPYDFSS
jgi:FMN phosphatase YigB (HAD superfamily)